MSTQTDTGLCGCAEAHSTCLLSECRSVIVWRAGGQHCSARPTCCATWILRPGQDRQIDRTTDRPDRPDRQTDRQNDRQHDRPTDAIVILVRGRLRSHTVIRLGSPTLTQRTSSNALACLAAGLGLCCCASTGCCLSAPEPCFLQPRSCRSALRKDCCGHSLVCLPCPGVASVACA